MVSTSLLWSGNRYQHIEVISFRLSVRDRFCLSFLPARPSYSVCMCWCVGACVLGITYVPLKNGNI